MRFVPLWSWVLLVCISCPCPILYAQKKQNNQNNQRDERRENERVADAEKNLKQAQNHKNDADKALRLAARNVQAANAAVQSARVKLNDVHDQVADKLADSLGIDQAVAKWKQAKSKLEEISRPIVTALHATEPWKTAKAQADKAHAQREKLLDDVDVDDKDRAAQLKTLESMERKPSELEQQAIAADAKGKKALAEVEATYEAAQKIRKSISEDKIAADPQVVRATKDVNEAESKLKNATKELASARSEQLKQLQKVNEASQSLAKAKMADAADSNRPKKKG